MERSEELEECGQDPPNDGQDPPKYCNICFKKMRPLKKDWNQREYHVSCWVKHKRYIRDWDYLCRKVDDHKLAWLFE